MLDPGEMSCLKAVALSTMHSPNIPPLDSAELSQCASTHAANSHLYQPMGSAFPDSAVLTQCSSPQHAYNHICDLMHEMPAARM